MASVQGSDHSWVGSKSMKQAGGMSEALSIASGLGFSSGSFPYQRLSFRNGEKDDDFVKLLRKLSTIQRKIADLHVELQGRKEDMNVAHLTHVSEMEKKIETLARYTTVLKGAIQNKDRIIARLQQPCVIDCIPVEAEYQKQFSELLMMASSDYGTLTVSVSDLHWAQNFKEPLTVWGEMLHPNHVALISCTRYYEAMTAMRESFATLQTLRLGSSRSPVDSECVTPRSSGNVWSSDDVEMNEVEKQGEDEFNTDVEDSDDRRLSWPSDKENDL